MSFAAILACLPIAAIVAVCIASLLRAVTVKRQTGVNSFAIADARGAQRVAGMAFTGSIVALTAAAAFVAIRNAGATEASATPAIGASLAVGGATLVIVAQLQMGRAWRVGVRQGDAPLFVQHGMFRFSRNPIFLGMAAVGLGVAIASQLWWAWLAWPIFIVACHFQIRIEEAHLLSSFGGEYGVYRSQVPRWIGLRTRM